MGDKKYSIANFKPLKMKLFALIASLVTADFLADIQTVTITQKEKQKVHHLKKYWPVMMDLFFTNAAHASRPVGAARFAGKMKTKMAKWHTCGRASMDPTFERVERFDHTDPFKGM